MSFLLTIAASSMVLCAPFYDETAEAYGYRNCDGGVGLAARFYAAEPFNACGIAVVMDLDGVRVINRQGETLIHPMVFDNGADPFSEGLARYVEDGKYGYFDKCGKVAIPAQYDFALPFKNGKARAGYDCTFPAVPPSGEYHSYECQRWVELDHPVGSSD